MIASLFRHIRAELLLYVANRVVSGIPSHRIRLFFYRHVMRFAIGTHSHVFMNAWFDSRGGFTMGNYSVVNPRCHLDTRGGIEIGNNVSISADVCILTLDHDPHNPGFTARTGKVAIEDYVFVGTRAIILRGVTLGRGAIVAAGAVVTRSVDPFTIVAGVPARPVGRRNEELNYQVDYCRLFG